MDESYITRFEFESGVKRIDEENTRQNRRIEKLEKMADQLSEMASAIKVIMATMQSMEKEQEKQGVRLEKIEDKPADRWNMIVNTAITVLATAAITWLFIKGGP